MTYSNSSGEHSRKSMIRNSLEALWGEGLIRSWYAYAPGDRGTVWVVESLSGSSSFNTREVEAFILGAKAVMFGQHV